MSERRKILEAITDSRAYKLAGKYAGFTIDGFKSTGRGEVLSKIGGAAKYVWETRLYTGWRTKENEKEAERLADFLLGCREKDILSAGPISIRFNDILDTIYPTIIVYDRGALDSRKDMPYPNFIPPELTKEEIIRIIKRGIDRKGKVLEYLPGLENVPQEVVNLTKREIEEKNSGKKLSEILQDSKIFNGEFPSAPKGSTTSRYLGLMKNLKRMGGTELPLDYALVYRFVSGNVNLDRIEITIPIEIELPEEAINSPVFNRISQNVSMSKKGFQVTKMEMRAGDFYYTIKRDMSQIPTAIIRSRLGGCSYSQGNAKDLENLEKIAMWLLEKNVLKAETEAEKQEI